MLNVNAYRLRSDRNERVQIAMRQIEVQVGMFRQMRLAECITAQHHGMRCESGSAAKDAPQATVRSGEAVSQCVVGEPLGAGVFLVVEPVIAQWLAGQVDVEHLHHDPAKEIFPHQGNRLGGSLTM